MILVEVEVPILETCYDMQLDEYTPIRDLMEDMIGMICQKEQLMPVGDTGQLQLYTRQDGRALLPERSLHDYGMAGGQRLMLI